MNRKESNQLLGLIKVAYPSAYRDKDRAFQQATVEMWYQSFAAVPYPVMIQAFNSFRMHSKFPPTVAEMVEELKGIHQQAKWCLLVNRAHPDRPYLEALIQCTQIYVDGPEKGYFSLMGGEGFGTPGNYLDRADRVPFLDAGE